jgi:SAM-dependent methyltransferase
VQWVSTRLLIDLWRIEFQVDVRSAFAGLDLIGLWLSAAGLYFFDPPCAGDDVFYATLFNRLKARRLFVETSVREEFRIAARRISAGARILDVGSGHGAFRLCVPHASYAGIDPNIVGEGVRNETLERHLTDHEASYDAVCCFQVVEHVRDPKAFFAGLVRAAKPGGLIVIGVPHAPSAMTRIPNFLMSAPPHHLTWWSKTALAALAESGGALVENIAEVPWGAQDAAIAWMARCSPIRCSDTHFRGAASWHVAALTGYLLGSAVARLLGPPRAGTDEGAGLLMIARRP